MVKIVSVNERGALTLPKEIRERLGVLRGGQLSVEIESEGDVILKAGVFLPIEVYSKQREAEFAAMNEGPLVETPLRWQTAK
jgi:AbrB family looped-hinge helix DNA binding protein